MSGRSGRGGAGTPAQRVLHLLPPGRPAPALSHLTRAGCGGWRWVPSAAPGRSLHLEGPSPLPVQHLNLAVTVRGTPFRKKKGATGFDPSGFLWPPGTRVLTSEGAGPSWAPPPWPPFSAPRAGGPHHRGEGVAPWATSLAAAALTPGLGKCPPCCPLARPPRPPRLPPALPPLSHLGHPPSPRPHRRFSLSCMSLPFAQ